MYLFESSILGTVPVYVRTWYLVHITTESNCRMLRVSLLYFLFIYITTESRLTVCFESPCYIFLFHGI